MSREDGEVAADALQRSDDAPAGALAWALRVLATRGIPAADLLAAALAILAGAGIEFAIHAAGPWRWDRAGRSAERRRLGTADLRAVAEVVPYRRTRWCGVVGASTIHYIDNDELGYETPELAAEATDAWLRADKGLTAPRWALAPGGLPPRDTPTSEDR